MKKLTKTLLAIGLLAIAGTAAAVPITGSIGFSGAYTHDGTNLADATTIDVTGDQATVTGIVDGSFAAEGIVAGDIAVYHDFVFDPVTVPVIDLWNISGFSFDLNNMVVDFQSSSLLALSGSGAISHTGYDTTFGTWTFTANQSGSNFTFSSSTAPEPGVVLLLGAGLIGIGASRKLRKTA